MEKDLTVGDPLKLIITFSLPMLFGNLFQQLYNMVDSIIVGRFVSTNALAAVGSTGALNFLILGFAIGICTGFGIKIAQAFGAKDYSAMRRYVINGTYWAVIVTVFLTIFTALFTKKALILMGTPDEILEDAYHYIIIIFLGTAAIMGYNYISCILRALGDSKPPLYFLIVASIINIVLDLVFVLNFEMGVKGVGYATVIAQGISAVLSFFYMKKHYPILKMEPEEFAWDQAKGNQLLGIGVPMGLQFSITAIGSVILQAAVNSLGAISVAAVTAGNRLQIMFTQPLETIGLTMATYCGQNLGAQKYDRIHKGIKTALILSFSYSILMCIFMMIFAPYLILLFVKASETVVISQATIFLRLNAIFYVLLGLLFVMRNSLQGLGFSILPMFAGVVELIGRTVVALGFVDAFGFYAVCLASAAAWILADILLVAIYVVKRRAKVI